MDRNAASLWDKQADQWDRIRPPLRPHAQDVVWAQEVVDRSADRPGAALRAMTVGVTPELLGLAWPAGSAVLRVDRSSAMVEALRAAEVGVAHLSVRGDWTRLPLATGTLDVALGDGSLNVGRRSLAEQVVPELRRTLRDGGHLGLRSFVRPDHHTTPDDVWDQLVSGVLPSFGIFKFHLLMALVDRLGTSRVHDAWDAFRSRCDSHEELARTLGWPVEEVRTIEAYRDQPDAYWFPTHAELVEVVSADFEVVEVHWPDYEMGDRCPTHVLRAGR